jgi:hypothetical protein
MAVDELMDCVTNGHPQAIDKQVDALRLKGQALLKLKEAQAALKCLSHPVLKDDAKAQKLLATARSLVKTKTAKDKKTWGKALKSMSAEGTMSAGRGRPARELEAEALQSVLGARRNMSTQKQTAGGATGAAAAASTGQAGQAQRPIAKELGVPEMGVISPEASAAPAPSAAEGTGDAEESSPLGFLAAAAIVAGLAIGGIAIVRAWQSSK